MPEGPKITNVETAEDFETFAQNMSIILGVTHSFDYNALYEELNSLSIKIPDNPSIQLLSNLMQKVQSSKDRAIQILQDATRNYLLHKRVTEILTTGWSKFTDAKSQDKREAEASVKLSNFIIATAEAESFWKGVTNIVNNLSCQQEVLFRQVSCYNMMIKLRDVGQYTNTEDLLKDMDSKSLEQGAASFL